MELVTVIVIAFSLVLVYFLGSTLVSMILELLNTFRNKREKFLKKQLVNKLGEDAAHAILDHSMVAGNSKSGASKISAKVFGYVAQQHLDKDTKNVLNSAIEAYSSASPTTKTSLATASTSGEASEVASEANSGSNPETSEQPADATADVNTATTNRNALSAWFEDFSSEMTAQYKKQLRTPTIILSVIVVILLNLDTIRIIRTIWENPEDTKEILSTLKQVDWATIATEAPDPTDTATVNDQIRDILMVVAKFDTLESAGLPLGWKSARQLGMVIPAADTTALLKFNRVMKVDTTSGRRDTSYSFAYLPPSGAASFQPDARVKDGDQKLLALFPSAIPQPNPRLVGMGDALQLDFSSVFGKRKVDSLSASLQGITENVYSFKTAGHTRTIEPSLIAVIGANLKLVDGATLFGWVISIIALSMGAPFWFDVIKRLSTYVTKNVK